MYTAEYTAEFALPIPASRRAWQPNHHVLGTLGILGAPMLLIAAIVSALLHRSLETPDRLTGATGLFYMTAWMCSAAGMRRLRAAGDTVPGRLTLALQWIGHVLAMSWAVLTIVNPVPEGAIYAITDFAWPASHVFMIAVGIAVASAAVWKGWQRWMPLACGLVFPISGLTSLVLPHALNAWVFTGYAAIAWTLLGVAVRTRGGRGTSLD